MIKAGRIDELVAKLKEEIYVNSLKRKPNAKKRYSAMKKFFSYADSIREVCQKPCRIEFDGKEYTSFTNSYTLVLTTEDTGEIELFDTETGTYPDVGRLINFEGEERKIDLNKVIAEAKSQGYKLKKYEFFSNYCLMHYDGSYFRIPLIDSAYGIIADDGEVSVYHGDSYRKPLVIKNDIGIAVIMPINRDREPDEDDAHEKIIIEVEAETGKLFRYDLRDSEEGD
jgi:hypothetical protein